MKFQLIFPIHLAILLPAVLCISTGWGSLCSGNEAEAFRNGTVSENQSTGLKDDRPFSGDGTLRDTLRRNGVSEVQEEGTAGEAKKTELPGRSFRRVYVPEALLPSVPIQGGGFWPVPALEFERWAELKDSEHVEETDPRGKIMTHQARYEAELLDPRFLSGRAEFLLQCAPVGTDLASGSREKSEEVPRDHVWKMPPVRFAVHGFLHPGSAEWGQDGERFLMGSVPVTGTSGELRTSGQDDGTSGQDETVAEGLSVPDTFENGMDLGAEAVTEKSVNAASQFDAVSQFDAASPVEMQRGRRHFRFLENGVGEVELSSQDFDSEGFCRAGFLWSQNGVSSPGGEIVFDLEWIPSADTRWILRLPRKWIPETSDGIVFLRSTGSDTPSEMVRTESGVQSETPKGAQSEDPNGTPAGTAAETGNELRVWEIFFGGRRTARLVLRPAESVLHQKPTPLAVEQKTICQLSKNGIDVFVRMNLDILTNGEKPASQMRELRVRIDGGLVPVSVRFNEEETVWSVFSTDASDSPNAVNWKRSGTGLFSSAFLKNSGHGSMYLTITLPEEVKGSGNRLEINAVGSVDAWLNENETSLRSLPKIRLQNALLRESQTQLQIFSPMELADLSLENGSLLYHQENSALAIEELGIQEHSEDVSVKIALGQRSFPLDVDMTTAVDFQENEIFAVMELLASVKGGEYFEIWGVVDRAWTIDSVESDWVGLIEDWNLELDPGNVHQALSNLDPMGGLPEKLTSAGWDLDSLGILKIQLSHSVRPGNPVSLRIRGRRLGYANDFTFSSIQLAPLYLPTCQIGQSWILCGSSNAWSVHFLEPYRDQEIYWEDLADDFGRSELRAGTVRGDGSIFPDQSSQSSRSADPSESSSAVPSAASGPLGGSQNGSSFGTSLDAGEAGSVSRSGGRDGEDISRSAKGSNEPGSVFEMLNRAREHFPEHTVFLTGIQDFRTAPMLHLERLPQQFTVKVHGFYDIAFDSSAIFRISCDPKGAEIDRIQVMIRPGTLLGTSWKFPRHLHGSEAECIQRHSINDPQDLNASFELWEIRFPHPQREKFDFEVALLTTSAFETGDPVRNGEEETNEKIYLRASESALLNSYVSMTQDEQRAWWRTHFPDGLDLPLIDVLNASECSGLVTLKNDITDRIHVETREMAPTLLSVAELSGILGENALEDCVQFRFDPHAISNSPAPILKLNWKNQNVSLPSAWIWENVCRTHCFGNGKRGHLLTFRIENVDQDQMMLRIHPDQPGRTMELWAVWVDGQRLPLDSVLLSSGSAGETGTVQVGERSAGASEEDPGEKAGEKARGKAGENTETAFMQKKDLGTDFICAEVGGTVLRIPFPRWKREIQVSVQWLEATEKPGIFQRLDPPKFSTDLPLLQRVWQVRFPENFVPLYGLSLDRSWMAHPSFPEQEGRDGKLRDTLLVRLLGDFRIGQSFLTSRTGVFRSDGSTGDLAMEEEYAPEGTIRTNGKNEDEILKFSSLEYVGETDLLTDENCCLLKEFRPVWILHGNFLEACRGFFLILVCLVTVRFFASRRFLRICLCGVFAALTMIVPLVWTPVVSGIFLGILASFAVSSMRRHLDHVAKHGKPVIEVQAASGSGTLTATVRERLGGNLFRKRNGGNVENGASESESFTDVPGTGADLSGTRKLQLADSENASGTRELDEPPGNADTERRSGKEIEESDVLKVRGKGEVR